MPILNAAYTTSGSQSMVLRTFSDCTRCIHLTECDAHFQKGRHRHHEGPDSCEFVIDTIVRDVSGDVLSCPVAEEQVDETL